MTPRQWSCRGHDRAGQPIRPSTKSPSGLSLEPPTVETDFSQCPTNAPPHTQTHTPAGLWCELPATNANLQLHPCQFNPSPPLLSSRDAGSKPPPPPYFCTTALQRLATLLPCQSPLHQAKHSQLWLHPQSKAPRFPALAQLRPQNTTPEDQRGKRSFPAPAELAWEGIFAALRFWDPRGKAPRPKAWGSYLGLEGFP